MICRSSFLTSFRLCSRSVALKTGQNKQQTPHQPHAHSLAPLAPRELLLSPCALDLHPLLFTNFFFIFLSFFFLATLVPRATIGSPTFPFHCFAPPTPILFARQGQRFGSHRKHSRHCVKATYGAADRRLTADCEFVSIDPKLLLGSTIPGAICRQERHLPSEPPKHEPPTQGPPLGTSSIVRPHHSCKTTLFCRSIPGVKGPTKQIDWLGTSTLSTCPSAVFRKASSLLPLLRTVEPKRSLRHTQTIPKPTTK